MQRQFTIYKGGGGSEWIDLLGWKLNNIPMKCFYHNDSDGWCSAFWVRKYCEREGIPFTKEDFIEMNYDREFPLDVIKPFEDVFIVDFSLKQDVFWDLRCITKNITWIDHHKTAIETIDLDALDLSDCPGIRYDGIAACALTWIWYIYGEIKEESIESGLPRFENIIKDAPLFTQYIHLWDTWQWKNHPDAVEIEAFITRVSISEVAKDPTKSWWNALNHKDPEAQEHNLQCLISEGMACLHFRDGYASGLCKDISKVIEFEGYRCCVCNMGHVSSEWFKSIDPSIYDIMMPFYYNMQSGLFCFSLYTTNPDIDVSKIAVKYNGGGHHGSAGFQSRNLPF